MANQKALYSTLVAVLGFVCFVVGAVAVGLPMWGYYVTPGAGPNADNGYFGPWKTCKYLLYNRERCGKHDSRFRPQISVWLAGVTSALATATLGVFCILAVLQLAMASSKEKVVCKYSATVIGKLAAALLATLLSVVSAGLFALQSDDTATGFEVTRGPGFYVQVLAVLLDAVLFIVSLYDVLFSRRQGGDPTEPHDHHHHHAPGQTFGNPGFREPAGRHGGTISMTDASGKPYNGSTASMTTTMTGVSSTSNGSTAVSSITRSPLRSSLKKPRAARAAGELGIQNPGFSGTSPTLGRNGSMKKVRIQTHSTEV